MFQRCLFGLVLTFVATAGAQDMVPFPIAPNLDASPIALRSEPITEARRVSVREGRFVAAGQRVRIWGVNTCFAGNFPTHEQAQQTAARLAALGVNSIRFHHMDTAVWPHGLWQAKGREWESSQATRLSDEALERLDYFLDQLARRGIYANLNLHVGRSHSRALKLPACDQTPQYDKIVGLFTPELIEAQKKYARDLLGHVNPYRKMTYAADPAVAFVEISNEDSFFMWDGEEQLRKLAPYYAAILRGQYVSWLRNQYQTTAALREAWGKGLVPLGENVLPALAQRQDKNPRAWFLEQHNGCQAELRDLPAGALAIEVKQADGVDWHLQINCRGLSLKKGQYYTVSLQAKAEKPCRVILSAGQAHEPWGNLGLYQEVTIQDGPIRVGFTATRSDDNARIGLIFGKSGASFRIADVQLRTGGMEGLAEGESLEKGTVALFGQAEPPARTRDRLEFLAATEKAYFDGMRRFIRVELGSRALVTGTCGFGVLAVQAQRDMDYIDGHAYWNHPHFPGRPWDGGNWLVEQQAMSDHPERATLPRLGGERLAGKPYTVSEYNHPAPQDAQAQCVPMAASWAAAQDWDGLWFFAYCHDANLPTDRLSSFFDMIGNPAKTGFLACGAAIFRDGAIAPLSASALVAVRDPVALQRSHGMDSLAALAEADKSVSWSTMLQRRLYATNQESPIPKSDPSGGWLGWEVQKGRGLYAARGAGAVVLTGRAGLPGPDPFPLVLQSPSCATVAMVALDCQPLDKSRRILIAACGRCENTEMKFSADRRTVGRNWGQAPVLIEPVAATVALPPGPWTCQALSPEGTPAQAVPLEKNEAGRGMVRLLPRYKTMWYLLTRP